MPSSSPFPPPPLRYRTPSSKSTAAFDTSADHSTPPASPPTTPPSPMRSDIPRTLSTVQFPSSPPTSTASSLSSPSTPPMDLATFATLPVFPSPPPSSSKPRPKRASLSSTHSALSIASTSSGHMSDASASSRTLPPRPFMSPRTAMISSKSNYFNLDFSFLDDAPPPASASLPYRPVVGNAVAGPSSPRRSEDSSLGSSTRSPRSATVPQDSLGHRPRASSESLRGIRLSPSRVHAPLPPINASSRSSLTFPLRPSIGRGGSSLTTAPTRRYPPPSRGLPDFDSLEQSKIHSRRNSAYSIASSDMTASSSLSADVVFRGSRAFSDMSHEHSTPGSASSSSLQEEDETEYQTSKHAEHEKRKRLALFLDETAAMMEGGKSLVMVLPAVDSQTKDGTMTLADLSEVSNGSPSALRRQSNRFSQIPAFAAVDESPPLALSGSFTATERPTESPSTPKKDSYNFRRMSSSSVESLDSYEGNPNRQTVYFSPDGSPVLGWHKEPSVAEEDEEPVGKSPAGLGFDLGRALPEVIDHGGRQAPDRPLSVTAAPLSAGRDARRRTSADLEQRTQDAILAEVEAKRAERRRRTIHELVETEAKFASDMAVIRDIYLARARGADLASIADHVMSSGLGLGNVLGTQPPPSLGSSASSSSTYAPRRPNLLHRTSSAPREMVVGTPLLTPKQAHVVFANAEEVTQFAEAFSGILDDAMGAGSVDGLDRIGEVFLEMMPRIQSIYSTYCSRHHRAILLLQDLEPTIRPYLAECKNLSHGRTNAWDLASLLIKPVQRCLKYPLLLQQILEATPKDHPSRASLRLANTQILGVAEHINEVKKRLDIVGKIVTSKSKGKGDAVRRASTASVSSIGSVSFGRAVTKKFMRSTTKVKHAVGVVAHPTDDIFDLLTAQVDSTRSAIVAFSTEMRDFSSKAGQALEAQMRMVEGWRDVYAPLDGELSPECVASHDRLTVFLDEVLQPVLAGPWREMDDEIRHELSLKTEHLLSLFENPRSVIAKRNDKDHARFLAKRDPEPIDRRRSEEFALLTSQLREELPVFLNSCARYFNIIIGHFATAQARYYAAVQVAWCDFARRYGIQMSTLEGIEPSHKAQHNAMERLMENLAQTLGIRSEEVGSQDTQPLYIASAMSPSTSTSTRSGQKILSFATGDLMEVYREEADSTDAGGCGWVFGQKVGSSEFGWSRTENLFIVSNV